MSISELLLTSVVALAAFGPKSLPQLARHIGQLLVRINQFKHHAEQSFQEMTKAQQLAENEAKAKNADRLYKEVNPHE